MNDLTYINAEGANLSELSAQVFALLQDRWPEFQRKIKLGYTITLVSHNSYYVPAEVWPATGDIRIHGRYVETFVFVHNKITADEKISAEQPRAL